MRTAKSINSNVLLLLIVTIFITSISVNIFIENQNQDLKTNYSLSGSNNPKQGQSLETRNKITDVINQQSVYEPGNAVHVHGQVDYARYIQAASNQYWFIPFQTVEVYIQQNPCASNPCDTSSLSAYKLQVSSGTSATGGTIDSEPDGLDDTYGLLNNPNSTYLNAAKGVLSYDFNVTSTSVSVLQSLRMDGSV